MPTKAAVTVQPVPPTTTPLTTSTESTTKMSTIFNRIDLMLNKSWSVETTTITSTVSISTTTKSTEWKTTTELSTVKPVEKTVVNNVYGLSWKKQGAEFNESISWRNMR